MATRIWPGPALVIKRGGPIHRVTEHAVRTSGTSPVGADPGDTLVDPYRRRSFHPGRRRRDLPQFHGGGKCSIGDVPVRGGGTKGCVEVAALVSYRHLEQVAVVDLEDLLHPPDVAVEAFPGLWIRLEVDAAELNEQSDGRAELGGRFLITVTQATVDPFSDGLGCRRLRPRRRVGRPLQRAEDRHRPGWTGAPRGHDDLIIERVQR